MTSPKKIESNRRNSQKSTGPRTHRGKAASRFNALQLGVFASSRLLPGENSADYNRAATDLLQDCRPTGAVQKIFADQIVGAFWRLRRIEHAEQTYFKEIKRGQMLRFIDALSEDEIVRWKAASSRPWAGRSGAPDGISSQSESDRVHSQKNTDTRAELHKFDTLRRFADWDCTILDGLIPRSEASSKAYLDQQRRAVVRELLRALACLRDLQRSNLWR